MISLYLIKKDGNLVELSLKNVLRIYELDFVGFLISTPTKLEILSVKVFIGDFGCDIEYIDCISKLFWYKIDLHGINLKNTQYETNRDNIKLEINRVAVGTIELYRVFSLNVGETLIKFVTDLYETDLAFLEIEPNKVTSNEIEDICNELVENNFSFFSKNLSLTKLNSRLKENGLILSYLEYLEIFWNSFIEIDSFKNSFVYNKFYKIEDESQVNEWTEFNPISNQFDSWIAQNSMYAYQTTLGEKNSIYTNYKSIKFSHAIYRNNKESTDVLENHLIHYGLQKLFLTLKEIQFQLQKEHDTLNLSRDFSGRFVKIYLKHCENKIEKCLLKVKEMRNFFKNHIPINEHKQLISFSNIERIITKPHYAKFWDIVYNTLSTESNTFGNLKKVLKLNNLAKLYEQFCFLKLTQVINEVFNVNMSFYENERKFKSSNDDIIIYYENSDLFITTAENKERLKPDFIIEIKFRNDSYLIILDAKYKQEKWVKNSDIPESTLKYLHGMTPKNSLHKVIGLFLIFSKTDKQPEVLNFYNKNKYISNDIIYPLIGWVSASPNKTNKLKELIIHIKKTIFQ